VRWACSRAHWGFWSAGWARGRLFVDVGANIGTSTISALLRHGFAGAVAAEPEPENHRLLRMNLVLNDVDDLVKALPVALSDVPGSIELVIDPENSGAHRVIPAGGDGSWVNADARIVTVPRTTLDDLVAAGVIDPAEAGLLWLDVQGHEAHVIAGGGELLRRGVPIVLEFHPGMLRESGALDHLIALLESNYDRFVDLRTVPAGPGDSASSAEPQPTKRIRDLLSTYDGDRFTDLLVARET
jgi:FkbM family methyltransferase